MPSTTQELMERGLINGAAPFLKTNVMYETIMGSHAYGCADTSVKDEPADFDVYGWAIPPKEYIFPGTKGHILAFGEKPGTSIWFGPRPKGFEQFQKHHILDADALGGQGKEWDLSIFNIVKYFQLCWENNPNMLDSLFTPDNCVVHCTQIGQMVRDNRKLFLSKEAWKKFRGYAHAQLHKMVTKNPIGGRTEIVDKFGFDVKFAYHVVRLLDEAEQILLQGDMDLTRSKEAMKAVRRGDWSIEDVKKWAMEKEIALEAAYTNCKLPDHPPVEPLKRLLFNCLEEHYGSISDNVTELDWAESCLRDIDKRLSEVRNSLYK